jgi:hypothetical protein
MSKFIKKTKNIEIVDLSKEELFAFLKLNVPGIITFSKDNKVIDYITVTERLNSGQTNFISIKTITEKKVIDYGTLINMITEKSQLGILSVLIENKTFKEKEPLLLMIDKLNEKLINSVVYIDYDKQSQVYSIINKDLKSGVSDKLYYYETNDSILVFGEEGPKLIYGATTSIEDIICNK